MPINEVDQWLEIYDNPMRSVVTAKRKAILETDDRFGECIKWQAPTFTYKGNIASFFPRSKSHASLMFHKGSDISGNFPNLEGNGKEARTFKVKDLDDLKLKKDELQAIFIAWCELKDG